MRDSMTIHKVFGKSEILAKDTIFWPSSVSILTLKIDDYVYEFPWIDVMNNEDVSGQSIFLCDIEHKYAERLLACKIAALNNMTPLHDETYCYSKDDKCWHLIAEGKGYA